MNWYSAIIANSNPDGSPISRMRFHWRSSGRQSANEKWRYASFETKYVASHTMATTIETSDEIAAPATPYAWPVTQPKMRNGASTMLITTLTVDTIIVGLKLPMPRSAEPIAPNGNFKPTDR